MTEGNMSVVIASVRSAIAELSNSVREEKFREYGINDEIRNYVFKDPFAFLTGVLANQHGVRAGGAWMVPAHLRLRMGGELTAHRIARIPYYVLERHMSKPEPLHGYFRTIARYVHDAAKHICEHWRGRPELIWETTESVFAAEERLDAIRGMGPKKIAMMLKMLVRDWNWKPRNPSLIPVASDRHVARVFLRLGLIDSPRRSEIEHAGSLLNPYYPAGSDDVLWLVGRRYCHPMPDCSKCPFRPFCPKRDIYGSAGIKVEY